MFSLSLSLFEHSVCVCFVSLPCLCVLAKRLADYLGVALSFHAALGASYCVMNLWYQGLLDLIFALVGYMAIRHAEGYRYA